MLLNFRELDHNLRSPPPKAIIKCVCLCLCKSYSNIHTILRNRKTFTVLWWIEVCIHTKCLNTLIWLIQLFLIVIIVHRLNSSTTMKSIIFWDVTPYFEGTYWLHLQGQKISKQAAAFTFIFQSHLFLLNQYWMRPFSWITAWICFFHWPVADQILFSDTRDYTFWNLSTTSKKPAWSRQQAKLPVSCQFLAWVTLQPWRWM
jgi:hypothetical protein